MKRPFRFLKTRGLEVDYRPGLPAEELVEILANMTALPSDSATKVTQDVLDKVAGGKLKVIGRAGIGVDNIDIKAATHYGIVVMNTPLGML